MFKYSYTLAEKIGMFQKDVEDMAKRSKTLKETWASKMANPIEKLPIIITTPVETRSHNMYDVTITCEREWMRKRPQFTFTLRYGEPMHQGFLMLRQFDEKTWGFQDYTKHVVDRFRQRHIARTGVSMEIKQAIRMIDITMCPNRTLIDSGCIMMMTRTGVFLGFEEVLNIWKMTTYIDESDLKGRQKKIFAENKKEILHSLDRLSYSQFTRDEIDWDMSDFTLDFERYKQEALTCRTRNTEHIRAILGDEFVDNYKKSCNLA